MYSSSRSQRAANSYLVADFIQTAFYLLISDLTMGVSLQCYRISIGYFQPKQCKSILYRPSSTNPTPLSTLQYLLAVCLIINTASASLKISSSSPGYHSCIVGSESTQQSEWQCGLRGLAAGLTNKTCHTISGNRKQQGLVISSWNCGRAIFNKVTDIKLFIEEHKPHLYAISEADLHSPDSVPTRRSTLTTEEIQERLQVEGYTIILPDTWEAFNHARIIVYASNEIKVIKRENPVLIKDLPSITLEVGRGRERKSLVNFYYREWTGGVDVDSSHAGQLDRFSRQVNHWRVGRVILIKSHQNNFSPHFFYVEFNSKQLLFS